MASGPDEGSTPDPGRDDGARPEPDPRPDDHAAHDGSDDLDKAWTEIVSNLDGVSAPVDEPDEPAQPSERPDEPPTTPDPIDADPRGWVATEDDEKFEPPDPGPVLSGDPLLTMAWVGVIGPPMLLMAATILWQDIPTLVLQVAGAVFLAGLGVLIWRMPPRREDGDGPGAVV